MKSITVITLFEGYFEGLYKTGVVGQALRGERGSLPTLNFINPTDFSEKGFKGVDASPYGGGAGQVMKGDVLENALLKGLKVEGEEELKNSYEVIYLGPRGVIFNQSLAQELADSLLIKENSKSLVFVCGRYEGIDERFLKKYIDRTICLGDFVLSGGEVALIAILDAIFRLSPGVLSNADSPIFESFSDGLLEHPQYTKPQKCCGEAVPEVLLSGNHQKIALWRHEQKVRETEIHRPDLHKVYLKKEKK
jgi:tRNA (guanine37-N1)-methyltransferase